MTQGDSPGGRPTLSRSSFLRLAARGALLAGAGLPTLLGACAPTPSGSPPSATTGSSAARAAPPAAPSVAASPQTLDVVKQGNLQGTTLDSAIARARGYFAEAGIDAQETLFTSGAEQTPLLATGQLDVGVSSLNAAFFNSVAQGVKSKAVVESSHLDKGVFSYGVLIRTDLSDSFKTVADLKGRKIAISLAPNAGGVGFAASKMLATAGLTLDDVDWTILQVPQTLPALANKAVEGALVYEPFITQITDAQAATKWLNAGDYYPNDVTGFLVLGDPFIQRRPDVARRWMLGHVRGMRDLAAFKKTGQDKEIITPIISKATGLSADVISRIQWPGTNPDGAIDPDILLADQQQLLEWGSIKQAFPIEQLYDPEFVNYALQQLGKATA